MTPQVWRYTLYHVPRFVSSPIVMVITELDLPVTVQTCTAEYLKSREFLSLNPLGTVPALVMMPPEDAANRKPTVIVESGAIVTHLVEVFDNEHRLHPGSELLVERIKYHQMLFYTLTTVYPTLTKAAIERSKPAGDTDEALIEATAAEFTNRIGPFLVEHLGLRLYLLGDRPTVADFFLSKPLRNAMDLGLLESFTTLRALHDRLARRESYQVAFGLAEKQ